MMKRSMGISGPESLVDARKGVGSALDFVAREAGPDGFLVGDRFSVADLAAAALLAPVASPSHPDMARPVPQPERVQRFVAEWGAHPGIAWVLDTYRRHRPPSAAVPAQRDGSHA